MEYQRRLSAGQIKVNQEEEIKEWEEECKEAEKDIQWILPLTLIIIILAII